jgi:WD40 repeat protein
LLERWAMSTGRGLFRRHRWTLLALLVFPIACVGLLGFQPTRPRASWREHARVLAISPGVLAISPDGRALVTDSRSGARLRDAATGRERAALTSREGILLAPRFSPDGRLLFAEVLSERFQPVLVHDLKVWDVATGRERATFPHVGEGLDDRNAVISADGSTLAFLDNSERRPMRVVESQVTMDRTTYTAAHNMSQGLPRVRVWDLVRWVEGPLVDGGLPLALSADGKALATGDRDWHRPVAKVWDTATGRLRVELGRRTPGVWPIAFSPDGKLLASNGHAEVALWDLAGGRKWTLEAQGGGLQPPAFSPDGKLLFPAGLPGWRPESNMNQGFRCYDISALPPRRLDLGAGEPRISPDGRWYASLQGLNHQGAPCTIVLHDLPSLRECGRVALTGLIGARFSPDGRWLAVQVWRHEQPVPRTGLVAWLERQLPPALHRDEQAHSFRDLLLIDPATARVGATIRPPEHIWPDPDWSFSTDGKTLAVSYVPGSNVYSPGSSDDPEVNPRPTTVELWDVPPRKPVGPTVGLSALIALVAVLIGRRLDARAAARSAKTQPLRDPSETSGDVEPAPRVQ